MRRFRRFALYLASSCRYVSSTDFQKEVETMTMPRLSNCPHSSDGWCLSCVKELHDRAELLQEELQRVADMLNDIFFDPTFRPVDENGKRLHGEAYYSVERPLQEHHIPALRQWFVNFQGRLGPIFSAKGE